MLTVLTAVVGCVSSMLMEVQGKWANRSGTATASGARQPCSKQHGHEQREAAWSPA